MKKDTIEDYLMLKGLKPHFRGFAYLVDAISTYRLGMMMTKQLYPEIAKMHSSRPTMIERCIRNAINDAGLNQSNSEFIALAHLMCKRREEQKTT